MIWTVIVDDDSLIHVTLRSLIDWESCGCTVVQDCSNGAQALAYLCEHPADLLITDIYQNAGYVRPGADGRATAQRLLAGDGGPVRLR